MPTDHWAVTKCTFRNIWKGAVSVACMRLSRSKVHARMTMYMVHGFC